jgi:hypothetical protein
MADLTQDEFNAKAMANSTVSGFGLEVAQHFPCPGCAEADWKVCKIVDIDADMAADSRCAHCGRSFKVIIERDRSGVRFEFVQTGGDDPPAWSKMRRV